MTPDDTTPCGAPVVDLSACELALEDEAPLTVVEPAPPFVPAWDDPSDGDVTRWIGGRL